MNGSATAIWIIVAVAVAGLVIWLGSVALAARKPHQENAHGERLRGTSRAACTSAARPQRGTAPRRGSDTRGSPARGLAPPRRGRPRGRPGRQGRQAGLGEPAGPVTTGAPARAGQRQPSTTEEEKVMNQPAQQQEPPGRTGQMNPRPDHGEESYRGSGRLAGKAAVITGADSGIGRAVAIAFAREGADVLIAYLDEHDDAPGDRPLGGAGRPQGGTRAGRPGRGGALPDRHRHRRQPSSGGSTSWSATRPSR